MLEISICLHNRFAKSSVETAVLLSSCSVVQWKKWTFGELLVHSGYDCDCTERKV